MQRVGRNDPCPCGSGRKYKRCCQPHEASRAAFAAAFDDVALSLLQRLARFAEAVAGASAVDVAREAFPFWRPPLTRAHTARILDYLIFDQRPGHGSRTADRFAAESRDTLDEFGNAMLDAWLVATRRPYVARSWSGGFTTCTDLLDPTRPEVTVIEADGAWRPDAGEISCVRPLPVGGLAVCVGRPMAFASRDSDAVAERIRSRHLDFVRTQRIVGLEEFLRVVPTALDEEASRRPAASIIVPGA